MARVLPFERLADLPHRALVRLRALEEAAVAADVPEEEGDAISV